MGHKWDIWGYNAVQKCPRGGFKPETRIVVRNLMDVLSFVCIKGHACTIVQNRSAGYGKRLFVAIDQFSGKRFKATFSESSHCFVPIVTLTDYQLVSICEKDSKVALLLDEKGNMRVDLKLPTDQDLRSQIKFEFAEGKDDVFVSVASAVGKEQIIASSRRSLLRRFCN